MKFPRVLHFNVEANKRPDLEELVTSKGGALGYAFDAESLADHLETTIGWDVLYARVPHQSEPVLRVLKQVHEVVPGLPIILEAASPDIFGNSLGSAAVELIRCGASELVIDPDDRYEISSALDRVGQLAKKLHTRGTASGTEGASALGSLHMVSATGGGSGRTLLATCIASTLANENRTVCLIDLDHPYGGVSLALSVNPRFTVHDAAALEPNELANHLQSFCEEIQPGLFVLAAASADDPSPSVNAIANLITAARKTFSHVVLDCPPTTYPVTVSIIPKATSIWCVTTPDLGNLRALHLLIEGLDASNVDLDRIHVVLNKYSPGLGITAEDVTGAIGREPVAIVPYDRSIAQAINAGIPITTSSARGPIGQKLKETISGVLLEPTTAESADEPPRSTISVTAMVGSLVGLLAVLMLFAKGLGWT